MQSWLRRTRAIKIFISLINSHFTIDNSLNHDYKVEIQINGIDIYKYLRMEDEKFTNILSGSPAKLSSQDIIKFGVFCSGQGFHLDKYMEVAKTLYQADKNNCYEFLSFIEKHEINRNSFKDFQHQSAKIQIYNCLLALTLSRALRENSKEAADGLLSEARKYLNLSIDVKNSAEKTAIILRSFMTYFNGDFNNAYNIFVKSFHEGANSEGVLSTVSLLGLAEISFVKKNYAKALEYYKKALISNKNLPSKARLGMGYCFYELQKYQLAELCFKRIIKLDPKCSDAYMGLAVICFKDGDYQNYFNNLKKAYNLCPNNPLVMLHLAQHFFISGKKEKARAFCERGMKALEVMPKFLKKDSIPRNDHQQFKVRFNNIVAQIHHSNNQYEEAMKYYLLGKGKGLMHNDVGLAQCYIQANMLKQGLQILETMSIEGNPKQLKLVSEMFKTIGYLQVKMQAKPLSERGPNFYYKEALKFNPQDYEALIDYSVYLSEQNKEKTLEILLKALGIKRSDKEKGLHAELLNNTGVFYLENKKYVESRKVLEEAEECLEGEEVKNRMMGEDAVKYDALLFTVKFNKAVAYQKLNLISQSLEIHKSLIASNQYYMDSYIKIAELAYQQGSTHEAYETLQKCIDICTPLKLNSIRMDKLFCMKAHLQHLDGGNLDAKETLKKLGKHKYQYGAYYEICMGYETVVKKQLEMVTVKDFIRPNREYLIGVCNADHYNFYCHMLLTVLLITDRKISKEQAIMYFNYLKVAELEFPEVLLNFGIFQLLNEDYDNALFSLNRFRDKSRSSKANEYIALAHYLKKNYDEAIRVIKRNIAIEPSNVRYRYQLACVLEKRLYQKFEEGKNIQEMLHSMKTAEMAKKIYEQFVKLSPGDYMRGVENPHMKDYLRNQISKIRSTCDERLRLLNSRIKHYQKLESELIERERMRKEEENRRYEELAKAKQTKLLMDQLNDDDDDEEREKELAKKRNEYLMEKARMQMEEANRAWEDLEETRNKQKQQKKSRKTNPQGRRPRRERKPEPHQEINNDDYESELSFKGEERSEENEYEEDPEIEKPKKKKKNKEEKRKKKKKERERERERRRERGDDQGEGEEGDGYENEKDYSRKNSSQDLGEDYEFGQQIDELEALQDEGPKKKKKKNKDDEEDLGVDFDKYLIQ